MIDFEIIIGRGLKNLAFGDQDKDIVRVFGNPDEEEYYEYPDKTKSKLLRYGDLDISFTLSSEENYRLTEISIYSPEFHINNKIKIGMKKSDFIKISKGFDFGKYEIEDSSTIENPTHELISFDKISTFFWFDYDKLSSIQIGHLWKDENTIEWPE
jgi:hypothetical protein